MRIVLDANVLVSAVVAKGAPHRVVNRWLELEEFEVIICPALIAELEDVLGRPKITKRIDPELGERFLATLERSAFVVQDPAVVEATTRDIDDDYLVAVARGHGADYIVTGDKDLLEWLDQRPPVLTPAQFEQLLEG